MIDFTQLTDDVIKSSAGAAQRFLEACKDAIFRSNNRSADEALAMYNAANATDVYAAANQLIIDDIDYQLECPMCPDNRINQTCCGYGHCNESRCYCREGMFNTEHIYSVITF